MSKSAKVVLNKLRWPFIVPAGVVSRYLQLFLAMAKLFFNFCWIRRLRNVLERRFEADARQLPRTADSTKLNTLRLVQSQSSGPTIVVVDEGNGGSWCCDVREGCGGTLSVCGPEPRLGLERAPGLMGWPEPTLLPLRVTGEIGSHSAIGVLHFLSMRLPK